MGFLRLFLRYKFSSGLWLTDVYVRDKQNVSAAKRILDAKVRVCLRDLDNERTLGLQTYLLVGEKILKAFERSDSTRTFDRIRDIWCAVSFLRLWKSYLEIEGYDKRIHFISQQTYDDVILAGHSIVLSAAVFRRYYPDLKYQPFLFGSDQCEQFFSKLRGFVRGKQNFTYLDMLDYAGRCVLEYNSNSK